MGVLKGQGFDGSFSMVLGSNQTESEPASTNASFFLLTNLIRSTPFSISSARPWTRALSGFGPHTSTTFWVSSESGAAAAICFSRPESATASVFASGFAHAAASTTIPATSTRFIAVASLRFGYTTGRHSANHSATNMPHHSPAYPQRHSPRVEYPRTFVNSLAAPGHAVRAIAAASHEVLQLSSPHAATTSSAAPPNTKPCQQITLLAGCVVAHAQDPSPPGHFIHHRPRCGTPHSVTQR